MGGRKGSRGRGREWARWLAIILGVGLLAGGFVALRNAQVGAGHQLKAVEERMADLETEIELYEARIARQTSRPRLSARLRETKPDLRRLQVGEAVRVPRFAGTAREGERMEEKER